MLKFNKINLNKLIYKKYKFLLINRFLSNKRNIQLDTFNERNLQINYDKKTKFLSLEHLNKKFYNYPSVWLRDNCQCDKCFHHDSSSRIINWDNFNLNVEPVKTSLNESTNEITIKWSDNHESTYTFNWLLERSFDQKDQQIYLNEFYRPKKKLWNKNDFQQILQTFEYGQVLNDDTCLKEWLDCLAIYGVAIINGAPHTENEVRKLAKRVGFIRKTHYGEEFIVSAKPGTTNVAYLSQYLQPHTDLPYYEYKPGVNLLHCLVQSKSNGGENLLADAFFIAEKMRSEYPNMYEMLSKVLVEWSDVGKEDEINFHSIYRAPVICEGRDGQLERINHSIPQRDSKFTIPIELVNNWYQAQAKFIQLIHEEKQIFKTKPGDILTFDNIRLVHGRTGYQDKKDNSRHVVGAYLDWDEIYSRLRILHKQF